MKVYWLNLKYNGKSNEKQTIGYFECSNQKDIRNALSKFRESYPDYVLYNPVSDVINGGIYAYCVGEVVCIVE